jgi:hypothetical protein
MATGKKATNPENRQKSGRGGKRSTSFRPGASGNPGGRPKKTEAEFELEKACELKAPEALETILDLMTGAKQDSVRLAAAAYVIERRYGKALERKEVRTGPLDGVGHEELRALNEAIAAIAGSRGVVPGVISQTRH